MKIKKLKKMMKVLEIIKNEEININKIVKEEINSNYTLDDLLEYFCSNEHLDRGNEWKII